MPDETPVPNLHEFFPLLSRREHYSRKADGAHYSYSYFRERFQHEIAEDCKLRCVYCDSHEDDVGGRESMQIDHFRPYTKAGFEKLEDDAKNFHHACARCNLLKSDKWPCSHATEPHDDTVGFIDPFVEDRRLYFKVSDEGELVPLRGPAQYLIRVLALNRRYLKLLRLKKRFQGLLRKYEAEKLPQWEAALRGEGMTLSELAADFSEYRRLSRLSGS